MYSRKQYILKCSNLSETHNLHETCAIKTVKDTIEVCIKACNDNNNLLMVCTIGWIINLCILELPIKKPYLHPVFWASFHPLSPLSVVSTSVLHVNGLGLTLHVSVNLIMKFFTLHASGSV